MIQQLDFFKAPAPTIEQPSFIGADNTLILFPPSPEPTGAEAAERKAAPELLTALRALLACPAMCEDTAEPETVKAYNLAMDAIAKAEGEEP